jgi:hypothetical protein
VTLVYLAFMADNTEKAIFIEDLRTNVTAFQRPVYSIKPTREKRNPTYEGAEAEDSCLLCIPMVVYNAILRETGKRMGTSIFRAVICFVFKYLKKGWKGVTITV